MTQQRDAEPNRDANSEAETVAEEVSDLGSEDAADAADAATLDAYDLDGDGRVSLTENVRAELGIIDARAEELAEEPGLKGKVAEAAHRVLDKLDND